MFFLILYLLFDRYLIVIIDLNVSFDIKYINVVFFWNNDHDSAAICCIWAIDVLYYVEYSFIILIAYYCLNNEDFLVQFVVV